jgi:aspartyl-tRNA(Asn)/glutamyl-tRNA(Gln) amidotransferase subunit A
MLGDDVLFGSVTDLSQKIRERKISPSELTESYLQRIRRYGDKLNAFETVTADLARRQAREAEAEINSGRWRGPLHGIPWGAKDLFDTAGIRTSWGAVPCRDRVPSTDATVVARLRQAGAVLLGKCAMVEFAGGLGYRFADASASGPGRNPWDPTRWTGGSSSGSGAAVSGALVGFALGTETWGSILCPSAFCGITGLRPTYGRVSRAGAMVCSYTFDKVGPLARSAADCRAILGAIAGPDPNDPTASDEPLRLDRPRRAPSSVRAALIPLDYSKHGEPESKHAFEDAVGVLQSLGLKTEPAKLPDFPAADVAGTIITAEALSAFETFFRDGSVKQLKDPYAPYQMEIAEPLTAADLVKAWRMREVLQEKMAEFFEHYDVIVTPNFMSVAPPVDRDLNESLNYPDPVGGIGNACGLPAIALPSGIGRAGMPLGFQIMGSPWSEPLLLDLGEAFQKHTSYHLARPSFGETVAH